MSDHRNIIEKLVEEFTKAANVGNMRNALDKIPSLFEKLLDMVEGKKTTSDTPVASTSDTSVTPVAVTPSTDMPPVYTIVTPVVDTPITVPVVTPVETPVEIPVETPVVTPLVDTPVSDTPVEVTTETPLVEKVSKKKKD